MKSCLKVTVILTSVLVVLIVLFVLWCSNLSIVIWQNGFRGETTVVDAGVGPNGEYRIIKGCDSEGQLRLGWFSKGEFGLWNTEYVEDTVSEQTGMMTMMWFGRPRLTVFDMDGLAQTEAETYWESEIHQVYCGSNAVKKIEIPHEKLPPNAAVGVEQGMSNYTLHLVFYGDTEELNGFNMAELIAEYVQ